MVNDVQKNMEKTWKKSRKVHLITLHFVTFHSQLFTVDKDFSTFLQFHDIPYNVI